MRPRGILELQAGEKPFRESLHQPPAELQSWVRHFWSVRWSLAPGQRYEQHVLSHPSVHLVVERGGSARIPSRIVGVVTGRFTAVLENCGRVFGISFRPAGFRPFLGLLHFPWVAPNSA